MNLLKFLIETIKFEKKFYDYIYSRIGKEHRNGSLTSKNLLSYMKLLLLFYGKDIENKEFFPEKYFFFINPEESIINTNIYPDNKLFLQNNFSILFTFYIDKYSNNEGSDLIDITLEDIII